MLQYIQCLAHLCVSLFSSVHCIDHIVSSFKLPEKKLFLFMCLHEWECNDIRTCQPIFNTMHRLCNSNTEAFRVLNLHQSIAAVDIIARQGNPPKIFNTQQTYQPLTAEYGLGHLPERECIFTDTNKLGSTLPRYTLLSASV